MKSLRESARTGGNRRGLSPAGLVALLCLATPLTTAHADAAPGVATGTVTCQEAYPDGTTAKVEYPVEYELLASLVVDRWGPGYDVTYGTAIGKYSPDKPDFTFYLFSMVDPDNPDTFEMLYSETGKLDVKVDKNNQMKIKGKSFVAMDFHFDDDLPYDWINLTAECDWKLSGIAAF